MYPRLAQVALVVKIYLIYYYYQYWVHGEMDEPLHFQPIDSLNDHKHQHIQSLGQICIHVSITVYIAQVSIIILSI